MPEKKTPKERLDKLLVEKGLCESRSQAQSLILSGSVLVNDQVADKPGQLFSDEMTFRVKAPLRYVSRGGLKLEHALEAFEISVKDRVCLDVGASTGGFTDCLLQHGAAQVYAVDVGYGQLDWKLRQDPRVLVYERTHILALDPSILKPAPEIAVIDVSFISLKKVLPRVVECLGESSNSPEKFMIALVKPQFEYRDYCTRKGFKGVVTHLEDYETILNHLSQDLISKLGLWCLHDVTESPIQGPKGNREFLFYFRQVSSPNVLDTTSLSQVESKIQRLLHCNS